MRKLLTTIILILILTFVWTSFVWADGPGDLDTGFGNSGVVTTSIGSDSVGLSVAIQADEKILVAGGISNNSNNSFAVVRYTTVGSLDTTFGGTGIVTTAVNGWDAASVVVQPDQKILVAGVGESGATSSSITVARYNSNGSLDNSFGNGTGIITTSITNGFDRGSSVALQADDKIVVAGESQQGTSTIYDFTIVRYNENGTLDTSFNGTGVVTTPMRSDRTGLYVIVQNDEKIVVGGSSDSAGNGFDYDFTLVRYNSNGTLDTNFNGSGIVTTSISSGPDIIHSIAVQPDGKIIAAGMNHNGGLNYGFAVTRYNQNGSLDSTFNGTGIVTTTIGNYLDTGYSLALEPSGNIIVAGVTQVEQIADSFDITLIRFKYDGSLDTTFNNTGIVTTSITSNADIARSLAIQPDGKILAAGYAGVLGNYNIVVARYIGGSINSTYLPIILKN